MQINPTKKENSKAHGNLRIMRLAPIGDSIKLDYTIKDKNTESGSLELCIYNLNNQIVSKQITSEFSGSLQVNNLLYEQDYLAELIQYDTTNKEIARSPIRMFRTGYVPGNIVNYIHPEDYTFMPSGRSPASPSLLRLPNNDLLASHDIFWGKSEQNLTHVFISKDNGETWSFLSEIFPSFWTKLFYHKDAVYAFGMNGEYGDMNIFKSRDNGKTWSKPTLMCKGGNGQIGGPHKAPMPVVTYKGSLWTAFEFGSWSIPDHHSAGFASINLSDDLMVSENWTISDFLTYSNDWAGVCRGESRGYLEGNIVITPDNTIVDFMRYQIEECTPNYGRAIMLSIDHNHPEKAPTFDKIVKFHGNFSKFTIRYDERSGYYYSLVSRVTQKVNLKQRNCLTLTRSKDLDNWEIVRDVLNFQDNGWKEDYNKVGFQYVDWIFEGDNIIFLSRTAINNAYNHHNANYITFHRIRDFREFVLL